MSKALQNVNVFNVGKKRDEALKEIGRYLPDYYKLIEQTKSIDGYVSELEQKLAEQRQNTDAEARRVRNREQQIRSLNDQVYEYQQKVKQLQRERDKAQKIIDAIPADVRTEIDKTLKKGARRYDYER